MNGDEMTEDDLWTEQEWLSFSSDWDLRSVWDVRRLWPLLTERKYRLFAVACCRRIWELLPDQGAKRIIEALESLADGELTEAEWDAVCRSYDWPEGRSQVEGLALSAVVTCRHDHEARLANTAAWYCRGAVMANGAAMEEEQRQTAERRAQCDLVRELFGNPFRPIAFEAAWRTSDVTALAAGIYEERAFDRMPILTDALQDAGCDSDDLLRHLRDPEAAHVRGCWALDLVLGKE